MAKVKRTATLPLFAPLCHFIRTSGDARIDCFLFYNKINGYFTLIRYRHAEPDWQGLRKKNVACPELDEFRGLIRVKPSAAATGITDLRYEPSMRSGASQNAAGDRLSDRVDAVMGEIAALLDERSADEIVRAREVLASTYQRALERRRASRRPQTQ